MRFAKWGLHNPVPINLMMILIICMGITSALWLKKEAFPKILLDIVLIQVDMEEKSTPDQVDRNVVQVIQSAIEDIDGIKEINAISTHNYAQIKIEVQRGYTTQDIKSDVEDEISRIHNLPKQARKPQISIMEHPQRAIQLAIVGENCTDIQLRQTATEVKRLLKSQRIASNVELYAPRPLEISLNFPLETLQAKGLSIAQLAQHIQKYSFELDGGEIKQDSGYLTLKADSRKTSLEKLRKIPIHFSNGEFLYLEDLTTQDAFIDAFSEREITVNYNGQKAAVITVSKAESEDVIALCERVRNFASNIDLGEEFEIIPFSDISSFVKGRLNLVLKNALIGLALVITILSFFLDWPVAFWTATGIGFSLVGAFTLIQWSGGSINMISLFAFLMTTGVIVDDAIVMSESFFHHKQRKLKGKDAALAALNEVYRPVIAMMSTTIVAFIPLLFIAGVMGKFISILPVVVISALVLSLVEALFILPVHLAHHGDEKHSTLMRCVQFFLKPIIFLSSLVKGKANKIIDHIQENIIPRYVSLCFTNRYSVLLIFISLLILLFSLIPAGVVKTAFFPKVDADFHLAQIEFERGTPSFECEKIMNKVIQTLNKTGQHYQKKDGMNPIKEYFLTIGSPQSQNSELFLHLIGADQGRVVSGQEFIDKWRANIPFFPQIRSFELISAGAGPRASPVQVLLSSNDSKQIDDAVQASKQFLRTLKGVVDINSSNSPGQLAVKTKLKNSLLSHPISEKELMEKISHAYQGIKVDTFYRDSEEVDIYVRAKKEERTKLHQLANLSLNNQMTVGQVADIFLERDEQQIERIDGKRSVAVSANLDYSENVNAQEIRLAFEEEFLKKDLKQQFPKVRWSYSGEARSGQETLDSLSKGYIPALFTIYFILATLFRSYLQPLIIMIAIPFSFVGAIFGHMIMNIPINLMSGFGIVALTGIAVNDSLVLVDCINANLEKGYAFKDSLITATQRRFRPILLTSLTTIFGLAPVLLETSFQAQFLIPMVTSIVFGIAFATLLILILIPVTFAILKDIRKNTQPKRT